MGDDRHFLTGVVNGLRHRLSEIQVLDQLHFEMVFHQIWANHIRRVWRSTELPTTPGGVAMGNKFIPPGALTSFPFLA